MFTKNSSIPFAFQITIFLLFSVFVCLSIYYLIYIGNRNVEPDRRLRFAWKKILRFVLIGILFSFIIHLFRSYPVLGSTLFAFFVAIIVAFIINPLVNKLENKFGMKRGLATILVYLAIALFFVSLGILVIPRIVEQATNFITNIPYTVNYVLDMISHNLKTWNIDPEIMTNLKNNIKIFIANASNNILSWSSTIYQSIYGSLGKLVIFILIPIISYYMVVDKDKIIRTVYMSIPKKYKKDAKMVYSQVNYSMGSIVRGRIIMAVFVGVITGLVLMLMKIEFALVIGIITMVADIIPYVGPFMGFTPAIIFAYIASPMKAIWVGVLFLFIQWFENNILGPKVLGDSTGLHPLAILLSIIVGGGMFGVWGMILSVPFISLISIIFEFYKYKVNDKRLNNK